MLCIFKYLKRHTIPIKGVELMFPSNIVQKTIVMSIVGILLGMSVVPTLGNSINGKSERSREIDTSTALRVAYAALSTFHKTDFTIQDSTVIFSNQGIRLYYIFSLNPQGYLVISASYDLPPVIAYSFTNNFQDPNEPNILSELLTTDLTVRLGDIHNLPASMIQNRHLVWDSYLQNQPMNTGRFEQWPPEGSTPTGGWLQTNWHQNAPYNNFCPLDIAHGGRSVAGCPAVAMAQILNYHNTTNNIMFNDSDDYHHNYDGNQYWIDNDYVAYGFPSFPQLNSYLMTLQLHYQTHVAPTNNDKAAITFACGVAATQVYGAGGSGTFGVSQAYDAYQRFNCTTVSLLHSTDPELFPCLSHNMMDALPAHLAVVNPSWTSGHNVVVDGYNTDNYYHLNFGWGGSYNGWYLLPDEMPYGLTVIEGVIVDILKPDTGTSDLSCDGSLNWTNVTPDNTVNGDFMVSNSGEAGSYLDWQITEWPTWGTWTFTPHYGNNLSPEDGPVTVTASVIAPNIENQLFTGHIKIINIDNSSDYETIPVSLHTAVKIGADLSCDGSLTWTDIRPRATITGSFTVENIGKAFSNLSWEITETPEWGTWTFTPQNGANLTPEDGLVTINVSVIAPNKRNTEFTGQITIVNSKNNSDYETIPVSLATPYIPHFILLDLLRAVIDRFSSGFSHLRSLLQQ
jgi:hypothetical protein